MKLSGQSGAGGGLCEGDPPLISAANLGYGVTTAGVGALDDLALMTSSLPVSLSPTCRHYESPYRAVTWSHRHLDRHLAAVDDNFSSELFDGHYGTAQTLCPRRHRQVMAS